MASAPREDYDDSEPDKVFSHEAVELLALGYMAHYKLADWAFAYDRAATRAGCCHYGRKLITLSYEYVRLNSDADITDTILHEIAHALAGPAAGHGQAWMAICVLIGAKPVQCYNSTVIDMPKGKYVAVCGCGLKFHRHRKPKRQRYCRACGPVNGLLNFVR